MKLYIAGQKLFGAEVLRLALRQGHEVVGVCAPKCREGSDKPDRLRQAAQEAGVPWLPAGQLRAETLPVGVDLILAAHSHDFIGRRTRHKAALGAIGYHPSLLPLHRGRDAVRWALRMGDRVTGGSIYWLNDSLDAGDVAAQEFCFIRPGDTSESLWRRDLFPIGVRLFGRVLNDLGRGVIVAVPQDPALATWEPSWERPPLYRPDLPLLGNAPAGFEMRREAEALRR